jgi:hypothetical protein
MNTKALLLALVFITTSFFTSLAQLNGNYSPDLSFVEIPAFDGLELDGTVSETDFSLGLIQGVTSSSVTGTGAVSNMDFWVSNDLIVEYHGDVLFSSKAALRGSIASLVGAKATLSNVMGSGTYSYYGTLPYGEYSVTLTSVTGAFIIKNLSLNLLNGEMSGTIPAGSLKMSGYLDDYPNLRRSVSARYRSEAFGPYFIDQASVLITPLIGMDLQTSSAGVVTGSATGTFGNYDDVAFTVKGKRKSGVSAITLTSVNPKGISATMNLNDAGEISGSKNTLKILGYTLKY